MLLKNDGALLPLGTAANGAKLKIAMIGPHANSTQAMHASHRRNARFVCVCVCARVCVSSVYRHMRGARMSSLCARARVCRWYVGRYS